MNREFRESEGVLGVQSFSRGYGLKIEWDVGSGEPGAFMGLRIGGKFEEAF